jgi:hypothetical protein
MTFLNSVLDESLEKILCSYINTTSKNQIIRIKPLHALPWERVVFSGQHLLFEAVLSDQLEIKTSEIVTANILCYELRVRESLENIQRKLQKLVLLESNREFRCLLTCTS